MNLKISLGVLVFVLSVSVHAADDWHFLLSPYLWFAGAKGDLSTIPDAPATGIDVSPIDALNGTEASFMLMFEAKKGRHGVLLDVFYSDVEQEKNSTAEASLNWKAAVKDTFVTAGYTYEIYATSQTVINVIGGLRYWEVDTRLAFGNGLGSFEGASIHNSDSWADPLAGVDAKVRLGDSPVYLACFLGGGGASGGSDNFYDLSANVGFQLTDTVITSIGYRLLDVEYEHDSFVYDVKQEGWVLGLVWVFGTNRLARPDYK